MLQISILILSILYALAGVLPLPEGGVLAIARDLLGLPLDGSADRFLNGLCLLGVTAAIAVVYRRELRACLYRSGSRQASEQERLGGRQFMLLVVSFLFSLPGLVLGWNISFGSSLIVLALLSLVSGLVVFAGDRMAKGGKSVQEATLADAAAMGIGQSLSVLPGLSRVGLTLTLGIFRGLDPDYCLTFSMLAAIPYQLVRSVVLIVSGEKPLSGLILYFAAMVLSGALAYGALRLLRFHIRRNTAGYFSFLSLGASLLLGMLYLVS